MTREQREDFVRKQIFAYGSWEDAVQRIVDRWEDDCDDSRLEGITEGQYSAIWMNERSEG